MQQEEDNSDKLRNLIWINDKVGLENLLRSNQFSSNKLDQALQYSASQQRVESFGILLSAGANVESTNGQNSNVLHIVMSSGKGNIHMIQAALKSVEEESARITFVNAPQGLGKTPLCIAAQAGYTEAVKLLLESGADVDKAPLSRPVTPLMAAAFHGHLATVRVLLEHKADFNKTVGKYKSTALIKAIKRNHLEIVMVLIEAGSDLNVMWSDKNGTSLLMYAAEKGGVEIAEILIDHGALVNQTSDAPHTPLSLAITNRHVGMIEFLISKGADLEEPCEEFDTSPFLVAVKNDLLDIVKILVNSGVDVRQVYDSPFALSDLYQEKNYV